MKYVELKNNLKVEIKNNYLLTGNDEFLLRKSCELIFKALNLSMPELNYLKYNSDTIDLKEVVKNANTMPLFDEKKLIVVNASGKVATQNASDLTEYLKSPNKSSVLVLMVGENEKDFKQLMQMCEIVDCNRLPEKIIDSFVLMELKKTGTQITKQALELLNSYCVYDLTKINKELEKLVNFVNDKKLIDKDDVVLLVNKTLEFQIYELTENLAKKNKEKVFELTNNLKSKKDTVKSIIPLIYSHFRRLFHVAISKSNKSELSNFLGVKEYAITVAFNQSKLFSKRQLKQIVDICEEIDYEMKQSIISTELAIDYVILKILNIN